jgi:mannose-6-phosphate isomerase-like protein (cupin superfamily)
MDFQPIDITSKFERLTEQWSPKVIAKMNDYLVKIGKLQGDFVWHQHEETDELFIVNKGILRIDFRDGQVILTPGQMFIVPKGVEHKTHADLECEIIMIEPMQTLYTGNVTESTTVEKLEWI